MEGLSKHSDHSFDGRAPTLPRPSDEACSELFRLGFPSSTGQDAQTSKHGGFVPRQTGLPTSHTFVWGAKAILPSSSRRSLVPW
jgi:hypothetical protein